MPALAEQDERPGDQRPGQAAATPRPPGPDARRCSPASAPWWAFSSGSMRPMTPAGDLVAVEGDRPTAPGPGAGRRGDAAQSSSVDLALGAVVAERLDARPPRRAARSASRPTGRTSKPVGQRARPGCRRASAGPSRSHGPSRVQPRCSRSACRPDVGVPVSRRACRPGRRRPGAPAAIAASRASAQPSIARADALAGARPGASRQIGLNARVAVGQVAPLDPGVADDPRRRARRRGCPRRGRS